MFARPWYLWFTLRAAAASGAVHQAYASRNWFNATGHCQNIITHRDEHGLGPSTGWVRLGWIAF